MSNSHVGDENNMASGASFSLNVLLQSFVCIDVQHFPLKIKKRMNKFILMFNFRI